MFKKFFGKKNDGFYMQIEDDASAKVEAKAKPSPVVTPAPAVVATTPIVADAAPAAADVAVTVGEKPKALTPEEKKIADAEKAVAKTAVKAEKKSAKKAVEEKKVAPVAPALPPITNFATDYLIKPSSDSTRRRPGANMSKFIELAREAKIPVNIKK